MTPVQPPAHFTQQVLKLLPDITIAEYQKILDMKAVKRTDQLQLIDLFKHTASAAAVSGLIEATVGDEDTQGTEPAAPIFETRLINGSSEERATVCQIQFYVR